MEKITERIITIVLVSIMTIFILLLLFGLNHERIKRNAPFSQEELLDNCKNLDVIKTGECLNKNVKTFFIYNESNVPNTFQDYKTHGGICSDWAKLYFTLSISLGYESEVIETKSHAFAFISDGLHGCVLDMKKIECGKNITKVVEDYVNNYVDDPTYRSAKELRENDSFRKLLIEATTQLNEDNKNGR